MVVAEKGVPSTHGDRRKGTRVGWKHQQQQLGLILHKGSFNTYSAERVLCPPKPGLRPWRDLHLAGGQGRPMIICHTLESEMSHQIGDSTEGAQKEGHVWVPITVFIKSRIF